MRTQAIPRPGPVHQHGGTTMELIISDRRAYYFMKRIMDIGMALALLVVAMPIMLVAAIAILVYSPGPIFFVQERVGARRRTHGKITTWEPVKFRCLKFRTMKCNADSAIHKAYMQALIEQNDAQMQAVQERATEPRKRAHLAQAPASVHKLTEDSRVIRPGRLLRKLSIDELPQLINVLRGDMSMVGPRPAIPYEVEMYKPWHMLRLQAQPGITGLQQVRARCTADFDEQVKLDVEYIEHQSIWLDVKIALKTPLAVLFARGAY
jgi:lipopolysaccharide/colanic/teichoic acid biosynthesis glycosyltransferase